MAAKAASGERGGWRFGAQSFMSPYSVNTETVLTEPLFHNTFLPRIRYDEQQEFYPFGVMGSEHVPECTQHQHLSVSIRRPEQRRVPVHIYSARRAATSILSISYSALRAARHPHCRSGTTATPVWKVAAEAASAIWQEKLRQQVVLHSRNSRTAAFA